MATINTLYEKYGIQEVANVTFYRIDKKKETYESQRTITAASILKGAIKLTTVYPNDGSNVGAEEGFEAYVFEKADILTHTNYACDDNETITATATLSSTTDDMTAENIMADSSTKITYTKDGKSFSPSKAVKDAIAEELKKATPSKTTELSGGFTYTLVATTKADGTSTAAGTHEFTYPEQVLMLYAKNQNLLTRSGARYTFADADTYFGKLVFSDNFYEAPGSDVQIVVVGLAGRFTTALYDTDDVMDVITNLKSSITAKAYNVEYSDYAELIVEDEMGYFNPNFLGKSYSKDNSGIAAIQGFSKGEYATWSASLLGTDYAIANATTWGAAEHDSINDAIDALRQKKFTLDGEADSALKGMKGISGGYKVNNEHPAIGASDTDSAANTYSYSGSATKSNYSLQSVLEALAKISYEKKGVIDEIKVTANGTNSNRAIYVHTDDELGMTAGAFLYILTNKSTKNLANDKDGIFYFTDKKGNTVYYQDKIFAGVEHLALVVIGDKGLIFVAERCGYRKTDAVGWIVSKNGYPSDKNCKRLVENGLIHTLGIIVNDESFEATCSVSKLSIRKIDKVVNHYTPVLYLDSLKASTIEMSAEETYATGGTGNANLIGWDYGKNITLTLEDALYTPASMSAMIGNGEGDLEKGVKETKHIDRMEPVVAKRSFIVPAGNSLGFPSEGEMTAQAVFVDKATMKPYQDGTPIAEGETFLKWTRSVAYKSNSIGKTIEVSADKFPGVYRIVGDTFARNKDTGVDERLQFIVPQAKMSSGTTITLEAGGDPTTFTMDMTVLRPDDGIMMKLVQYDVIDNTEENDGSTMVKDTENLNLLDDAEMFRVANAGEDETTYIGATEY